MRPAHFAINTTQKIQSGRKKGSGIVSIDSLSLL